jgi:hypothetical protein
MNLRALNTPTCDNLCPLLTLFTERRHHNDAKDIRVMSEVLIVTENFATEFNTGFSNQYAAGP